MQLPRVSSLAARALTTLVTGAGALACAGGLAGCGQKGPLTLPVAVSAAPAAASAAATAPR